MATQVRLAPGAGELRLERPVRLPGHRVRWQRRILWALRIVAILCASYLIVANVLLRTRLLRNAISGPESSFAIDGTSTDLLLDYESAYSIFPGRVHVDGATVRGRERTLEWLLTLEQADLQVSLTDLLRRSFHVTSVGASGCRFRARMRLAPVDATPEVVAALPPITGFSDPPLLDEGPGPPPLTDANYALWMVELEDVDVENVREVWIHTVRAEGDARVRGRWLLRPQRWLEIGPATVDVNGVDVSYADRPFATGLRGSVAATVHPFDVQKAGRRALFDHVSYSGPLRGRAVLPGMLALLASGSGISSKRCEGALDTRIILDHGRLAPGSRATTEAEECNVEAKGLVSESSMRTELRVDADLATMEAHVSNLRISRARAERASIASIAATVTSRQLLLSRVFDDARFSADVSGAKTSDVGAWKDLLPATLGFVFGSAQVTADGHAEGSLVEQRGRGSARVFARHLRAAQGANQVTADVSSDVRLDDVSIPGGWAVGSATIVADDITASLGPRILEGGMSARIELRRAAWAERTFDLSGSNIVLRGLSARSRARGPAILRVPLLSAAAPHLELTPSGMAGHAWIDLPRAELVNLGRVHELFALPAGVRIDRGRGRAKLHADVELGSGSIRGDGDLVARGIRARVGATTLFADLAGVVTARRKNSASTWTDLSGSTLAITRAGTGNAVAPEDVWWGNFALQRAKLRAQAGARFDAKVRLTAKDASPATALVSENTGVPGWAANIFRMPGLDATAEVRIAPRSVEVHSFVAHGGSTALRAEYSRRHGRQDGAVLMDLGWLAMGYDLADGAIGVVLIGPEHWFERKTTSMRRVARAAQNRTDALERLARYDAMTPDQRKREAAALAARCTLEVRSCDGTSIDDLLRTAANTSERDALRAATYAPMILAVAKQGTDGAKLDPLVIGSLMELLELGGEASLDAIPNTSQHEPARGGVIAIAGRISRIRLDGTYTTGTLTTDAGVFHFATPFAINEVSESFARFRGVYVQRHSPADQPPSLVVVGAFTRRSRSSDRSPGR